MKAVNRFTRRSLLFRGAAGACTFTALPSLGQIAASSSSVPRFINRHEPADLVMDLGASSRVWSSDDRGDHVWGFPSVSLMTQQWPIKLVLPEGHCLRRPTSPTRHWSVQGNLFDNLDLVAAIVNYFVYRYMESRLKTIALAVPGDLAPSNRERLRSLLPSDNHVRVHLVPTPIAAAIGALRPLDGPDEMIVNIGTSRTEVAILSDGGIHHATGIEYGSAMCDLAIINHMIDNHELGISWEIAESIKIRREPSLEVRGRDASSGLLRKLIVKQQELPQPRVAWIEPVVNVIKCVLEGAASGSDCRPLRITLVGGGSLGQGLPQHIQARCGVQTGLADDPGDATIRGLAIMFFGGMPNWLTARRRWT